MQFVADGPDIPDALLQAHEEGRVVFFCGAGISYPAGLPGFKGLVDKIYLDVGTTPDPMEQDAYSRNQFDATLALLEQRLPGQRMQVRSALMKALQPRLRRKGATDTHAALLRLARTREDTLRLVTTNFDRVFERAAKRTKQLVNAYLAPMLPIPKNSRWDGLVYLHGLLPEHANDAALNRLVLTSGDFGLAYLTERWAARFVGELFRNYVVCFVGYSINDPVLRYMMDALAADRMLGEITPEAYALGDSEPGQENTKIIEWKSKGVAPILYEVPTGSNDHSALYRTLNIWAETYRDGTLGKERIVNDYSMARPSESTRQDDFVGRMLWALSHESGLPAKRFADFDPVPPLEWLEAFSKDRYQHSDLKRFGVSPRDEVDGKLAFSLIRRPTPYSHSMWMSLISSGAMDSRWDEVMYQLARWLVRHLNDPKLIIWLAQWGGQLHERLSLLIEQELNRFSRLELEENTVELEYIRANAPNAIPQPLMSVLWRLLLTGRVKSPGLSLNLLRCKARLNRYGLTTTLRLELRELLAPKVALKEPFHWSERNEGAAAPERLTQLVDWELVLASDHVKSSIKSLARTDIWRESLPLLLDDFQILLRDALDLLCELEAADDRSDRSYWDLPSISPHPQNRGFRDWVMLIELLRDAWQAVHEIDIARATRTAQGWFALPYPSFKRLALFAASHDGSVPAHLWVDWLLADDSWWLWSIDTRRETMRLLVLQGANLTSDARKKLEAAILTGPPRRICIDDNESEREQSRVDHGVWLHLAKLQDSGGSLGPAAAKRLLDLSASNPEWKLARNESDEFSIWMSGTGEPDYEERREIDLAPRKRSELVNWLKQPPRSNRPFYEDTWSATCRERFFHCACALSYLAREGRWPASRWREALQVWGEKELALRSWQFIAPLVKTMPDEVLQVIEPSVAWWLKSASKSTGRHEAILLNMCSRILALPHQDGVDADQDGIDADQPVNSAINHPVGHVAQVLLNLLVKNEPNDNEKLPEDLEPYFTMLCKTSVEKFRHGRVLLASRLITLFRIDRSWTEAHLLPLLNWTTNPAEAKAAWEGFLWSARLHSPLMIAFRDSFLDTANHYVQLGEHARQFATLLTYAGLEPLDTYTPQDFHLAISVLPEEGLQASAHALTQALEGAGEQREEYWRNHIQPFWQHIWPKSIELVSDSIAESLAHLSIAARGEFPSALSSVVDWLLPIEHPYYILHLLHQAELAGRFPEPVLLLLDKTIDGHALEYTELRQCLNAISQASPALRQDHRYKRLDEFSRQHGM